MSRSLPEMGDWDAVFDETYLRTYLPTTSDDWSREQALAAVALAEVQPGADVLDCPCGFGRHAIPLAEAGYLVTGLDRSESQPRGGGGRRADRVPRDGGRPLGEPARGGKAPPRRRGGASLRPR